MKRWLLAVFLVGAVVSLAQADYVIIIANLGLSKDQQPAVPPGGGGEAPGGEEGAFGVGGGRPPQPGSFRGGLGAQGSPLQPGSFRGNPGGGVIGPPGGLRGGEGAEGGEGFRGGVPGIGGQPGAGGPIESSPLLVTAIVEVGQLDPRMLQPNQTLRLTHRWGTSYFQPTDSMKLIPFTNEGRPMPTVNQRYQVEYNKVFRTAKPPIEKLLELAEWALGHGLVKECAAVMQKAGEIGKEHPAVVAFKQIEKDIARAVNKEGSAEAWKQKLQMDNYKIARSAHYAVLHTDPSDESPAVRARLARLEDAFRGFYFWFALQGKALPVPDHRLTAVLVTREDDFWRQHQIFDSVPLTADGFFTPRHNLAVFSATRLDSPYKALLVNSKLLLTEFDRDQLLQGKFKPPPVTPTTTQDDVQKFHRQFLEASTKALLLKALEADSERATVSHEGTRQLMAAAGLLPRNVLTPEWVQFGMGSFFETAKGSAWGGVGFPSQTFEVDHNYLFQYRKMSREKNLDKPATILENVVKDRYFREASRSNDPKAMLRARTLSWALTYFLAHKKLDGLMRYYKELALLPRDMELEEDVLLACFGRAFDLMSTPGKVDTTKMARFAGEANDFINLTPVEAQEMLVQVQKAQAELKAPTPPPVKP